MFSTSFVISPVAGEDTVAVRLNMVWYSADAKPATTGPHAPTTFGISRQATDFCLSDQGVLRKAMATVAWGPSSHAGKKCACVKKLHAFGLTVGPEGPTCPLTNLHLS